MKTKNKKLKLYSILLGTIIGLLVAEVGLRVIKYITFHNLDDIELGNRDSILSPEEELTLGQVVQLSSHQKIIYEFIPNSSFKFQKVKVEINKDGFRDKNYPEEKDSNSKRIIGIGDSGMFGWGVEQNENYLAVLEGMLNQSDSLQFEIINTSVPGYNTVMEVAVLENKIDLEEVDIVIIDFIENDFELPNFIRKKPKFWNLEKSFLLMFFEENFFGKKQKRDRWLETATKDDKGNFEKNPNNVPEEYQSMIGKKGYVGAMQKLKELSEQYGFEVLVMSQSPFLKVPKVVTQTCSELNFPFLDFFLLESIQI